MSETDRLRAQFEAATYLFEVTGEAQFKQFADANYGAVLPSGPSMWEVEALDSLLYYARVPAATPEVKNLFASPSCQPVAGFRRFKLSAQADLSRPMKDYTWGSNEARPCRQGCSSWWHCTAKIKGCPRYRSPRRWNTLTISMA
jgi:hypothetical protein